MEQQQLQIFSTTPRDAGEIFPMARAHDPVTSHVAAAEHAELALSKRRQAVYELVMKNPGRTAGEYSVIAYAQWGLGIRCAAETPHKRLPELEKLGKVWRGVPRLCADSGYVSVTWFPT